MKQERRKSEQMKIDEGVKVSVNNYVVEVSGEKGSIKKDMKSKKVRIRVENDKVMFETDRMTQNEKKVIGTFISHIKNMMKGVKEGYEYKLKVCAAHFPMNITAQNNEFVVKNFLGESVPRKIKIQQGAAVKVDGDIITVNGIDKEIVSQTAATIEQLTKVKNKDRTRFQDGIYITQKNEKIM